ncbi:oxidoreductase nitrogenase component 1 [Clostridia bacterium]|nr:oxidoreductase nitrogenase component 1 [Clostridia bacterium]
MARCDSAIERPRFSCMLGGVLATVSALPKAIPIIHGAQGCGGSLAGGYSYGGYFGTGYAGNSAVPSTSIGESEIIFGGEDRLREELKYVFEVMRGDLFVVTTACMTDIIGDDVKAVVDDMSPFPNPVIFLETGGFKGNSYYGYGRLIEELFVQYIPKSEKKDPYTVNLFGLVPAFDPFFRGDLDELKRVLRLLGLTVNTFVTNDQTRENLLKAGEASLNIVVSRVYGVDAAKSIRESHGIDFLIEDLPIGARATIDFVRKIAEKLGLNEEKVNAVLKAETSNYYTYVDRATDVIADTDFQNYAVVVANATEALPYAKYLDNEIGWIPTHIFVTDDLDDDQKDLIREGFEGITFERRPQLVFETDTYRIQQYIEQNDPQFLGDEYYPTISPAFVLGSTIERRLAEVLNGPFLSVSFPIINRIVISKGYAGFNGGLALLEDLIGAQLTSR